MQSSLGAIQMITAERLRELLYYNHETGEFRWKTRRRNGRLAGSLLRVTGYYRVGLDGRAYLAHRLAWLWMTGTWPKDIDHVDRNPLNNRWSNLREATQSENNGNMKLDKRNKTGFRGVSEVKGSKIGRRWRAFIAKKTIGTFASPEEAAQAYQCAAKERWGRFFSC